MRRTTTSLATFSELAWALALFSMLGACGKRGDPLPPLRRVPAPADAVAIRQEADQIVLAWTAPARNRDGSTEDIDLREAQILRRVIDVEALVEEQTKPKAVEAEGEERTESEEAGQQEEVSEAAREAEPPEEAGSTIVSETTEIEPGGQPPDSESETPSLPSEVEGADVITESGKPETPARPTLQIPPFGSEAEVVATLESTTPGEAMRYREDLDLTWLSKRLEYAVLYFNGKDRRSPLSSTVQIEPVAPLEPPRELEAEAGDGFVALRWSPAEAEAVAYSVLRRRDEGETTYPEAPLSSEPVRTGEFLDRTVLFGEPWCYAVRTVLAPGAEEEPETAVSEESTDEEDRLLAETNVAAAGKADAPASSGSRNVEVEEEKRPLDPVVPAIANPVRIESLPSEEVCLIPEDVFPPPRPRGLVAVASADGILLSWSEVGARDRAGYRIYRSASADGPFELLNEDVVEVPSYLDETAEIGASYYYAVTAVDDAPRVNESSRSELAPASRSEVR